MERKIIAKHTNGFKANRSGGKRQNSWRLWSDGRLEKLGLRRYVPAITSDNPPASILEAAKLAGIEIQKTSRSDGRWS